MHGDKTFSCEVCNKEFKREDSRDRHEETVHLEKVDMQEQAIGNKELNEDQEEGNEEVVEHYLAHAQGVVTSFVNEKFVIIRHVRSGKRVLAGNCDLWLSSGSRAFKMSLTSLMKVGDPVIFHAVLLKENSSIPYFTTALWRPSDVENNKFNSGQLPEEVRVEKIPTTKKKLYEAWWSKGLSSEDSISSPAQDDTVLNQ